VVQRVRCFIAVWVEDLAVRERIRQFQEALVGTGAILKLVNPEYFHTTLLFLGEIPAVLVERVKQTLQGIRFHPIRARLMGVGTFGGRRPRVIWVGVREGAEELKRLAAQVVNALRPLGIRPDKEFVPHFTVARVKAIPSLDRLRKVLESFKDFEFGEVVFRKVYLKRSQLTPRGPIYTTLFEVLAVE